MNNRICATSLQVRKLSPVEAELHVRVEAALVSPATELRGKLMGPRCPGVTTVEIAYPLQQLPNPPDHTDHTLTARVIIDEPNLWTEQTPFLYEGVAELWQDGRRCDTASLSIGLKMVQ